MNGAIVLLMALCVQEAEPPTADQVIHRFIAALGGEMQLQDLTTRNIRIRGRVSGSQGITKGDLEWIYSGERKLFRLKADDTDAWHIYGTDGEVSWHKYQVTSDGDPEPAKSEMLDKEPGWFYTAPQYNLKYLDFEGQIEMIGNGEFNDEAVWQLKFTDREGTEIDRFFSQSSRLMVGTEFYRKNSRETQRNIYTYQEIDGVMWLASVVTEFGQRQEIELTEINLDADIGDVSFSPDE